MASSVGRQDESYSVLWLATQVGKMELSYPFGSTPLSLKKYYPKSHKINILLP